MLSILSIGLLNSNFHKLQIPIASSDEIYRTYLIQLSDVPKEKLNSYELRASVLASLDQESLLNTDESVVMYFQKCRAINTLNFNTRLAIHTKFKLISPPSNPDQFNYQLYMQGQDIYRSAYVDSMSWIACDLNSEKAEDFSFKSVQQKVLKTYIVSGLTGRELALVSALTIGYKDLIDKDMKSSFRSSGTIHVLAVSGLHVGIIFFILKMLLSFLNRWKRGPGIRFIVILSCMWFYALLSGFTPSVIRATLMFSLLLFGQLLKRDASSLNIIAASAFFILLFNPMTLIDVGFQFSYLAVIGIIYFHPKIYKLLKIRNLVLDKIWSLTVVSIAAQMVIAPLSIHYFNQFPTLFIFANLIVIPGITILLYLGATLLVFSFIPILSDLIVWLVKHVSIVIFKTIDIIDGIPFSLLDGIYLSLAKVILIHLLILMIIGLINTRRKLYLFSGLASILFINVAGLVEGYDQKKQSELVLLCNQKSSVLFVTDQGENYLSVSDSTFSLDDFYQRNKLFFAKRGILKLEIRVNSDEPGLYQFKDVKDGFLWKDKMILNSLSLDMNKTSSFRLDSCYLLIDYTFKSNLKEISNQFLNPVIIFDPSCKDWQTKKWKKTCEELAFTSYDMSKDGAFILD